MRQEIRGSPDLKRRYSVQSTGLSTPGPLGGTVKIVEVRLSGATVAEAAKLALHSGTTTLGWHHSALLIRL